MKHNDILTEREGSDGGMTVPEGYFESFNRKMAEELPRQPWEDEAEHPKMLPRTRWQRIRPYVYLAAMFMGIWCMMKMFDLMKPASSLSAPAIEDNAVLMSAIDNDAYYYDVVSQEFSDGDLYDDLFEQGFDPESINE